MESILTGAFIVTLYKTTELLWKKGFVRWTGTGAGSQQEAAFAQAADLAGTLDTGGVCHAWVGGMEALKGE